MKYKEAKEIGDECGLYTNQEIIDNIIYHAMNLFVYDDIDKELMELLVDARDNYNIDVSEWLIDKE
jgi:hypothetical protein